MKIARLCSLNKIDTIIVHRVNRMPLAIMARETLSVRAIVIAHGYVPEMDKKTQSYFYEKADKIIVLSKRMKKFLLSTLGVKKSIIVFPVGVDTEYFKPLNGNDYGNDVLFVGNLEARKGLHALIKAFSLLPSDVKVNLIVVGRSDENKYHFSSIEEVEDFFDEHKNETMRVSKHSYMNYAEMLGVGNKVIFVGKISEEFLKKLYSKALILVLPSFFEAFGLVVLEALSSSLPVIVSDKCGVSEILSEQIGRVFKAGDAKDLAEKITLTLSNSEAYRKMRKNARNYAERFSWSNNIDVFIKIVGCDSSVQTLFPYL